jgi:RNA methyltransferase, TrmH family
MGPSVTKRTGKPRPEARDEKVLSRIAGFAAVSAVFAVAPERVERLFFDERIKQRAKDFCLELARTRKPYRQVGADELAKIAGTPMHGGIVAVTRPQPVLPFAEEDQRAWAGDGKLLLILDGVGNPHNLGAIVRTSAFFGVPRLLLSGHPAQAAPSDASYRVAEGGFEHMKLYRAPPLLSALKALRKSYRVIGAAPGAKTALSSLRRSDRPFALVLGNEEEGVPAATLAACDDVVAIPGGGAIQSLNVSATAAILIYALSSAPTTEA